MKKRVLNFKGKVQFKDASTQTYRYVEEMPLPIILDIKSEEESNHSEELNEPNNSARILEALKIEIDEVSVVDTDEPHAVPVEEVYFEDKVNIHSPQPLIQIENVPKLEILDITIHRPAAKRSRSSNNGIVSKPAKKPKKIDKTKKPTKPTKPTKPPKPPKLTKPTKPTKQSKQKPPAKTRAKPLEPTKMVECSLCNFICKRPSHLKRHMLSHTGEKPHKCEHCPKSFAQKTDLNRHMSSHAVHYDFHCGSCGRGFPEESIKTQHEVNCKTKRYICDICNYMTFSIGNLHLHQRKHTGERPYTCPSCDKRFTRVAHLNQHVKLHANEFEIHCSMCGRGFADEHEMLQHELSCKNRMFQCHMCHDVHHRMDNLKRHIKVTHMGEKEVLCEFCSKQFPAKSSLTKHVRICHPERL